MFLSACVEWLYQDIHPRLADRVRAAKADGLDHVEFHLWRDKDIDDVAKALRETGVRLTSFVVEPRRSLVDPAQHGEFLQAVRESLVTAARLGNPPLVVASGFTRDGVSREEQRAEAVKALKQAASLAEAAGVMLVLEPLNTKVEHPGMFLSSTSEGLDIVEAVGSLNLKLLFDLYHSAVMEEDLEQVLRGRMHLVHHVQIADMPGRNEPGTGVIDWQDQLGRLRALGYSGAVGLEYKPTLPATESLKAARQATGL
ncbi:hydroxypyruvate isomerase family protein [Paracoccus aestuariivivens]|uniref:TIM barrel protein n=1 Tax=Paracoccus aestuariivivens TaxID=1820333 RepID=A0A6L6JFM8_9RHOB|nr:TIM barrel protein [Paracoccus aestuariivivens]MTH79988.1 TIM barrel protein [Paracoccus aestuariivivens]